MKFSGDGNRCIDLIILVNPRNDTDDRRLWQENWIASKRGKEAPSGKSSGRDIHGAFVIAGLIFLRVPDDLSISVSSSNYSEYH